jgi:hypothetical protein
MYAICNNEKMKFCMYNLFCTHSYILIQFLSNIDFRALKNVKLEFQK